VTTGQIPCQGDRLEYGWKLHGKWNHLGVRISGSPQYALPGSEEEFITEHYWGYSEQQSGASLEYRVEHPSGGSGRYLKVPWSVTWSASMDPTL